MKRATEVDMHDLDVCCTLFNSLYSEVYGSKFVPLSVHVILHLRSNFAKHDIARNYWCFPFERENEIIGTLLI